MSPALSGLLVATFIYFTGGTSAGAYAMYMMWIVATSAYFFLVHDLDEFDERLGEELERAKRAGGRPIGLVMLDLDEFKAVNHRFGHQRGDDCLVRFGRILAAESRTSDLAARMGGEEFAVLVPEVENRAEAVGLASRILGRVHAEFADEPFELTVSAGVSAYPEDADGADGLLGSADAALYEAKREGRDRTVSFGDLSRRETLDPAEAGRPVS